MWKVVPWYRTIYRWHTLLVAKVIPNATDEVGDNDGDDNEPENLVDIEKHVLRHNFFIARFVVHQRFEQVAESRDIN